MGQSIGSHLQKDTCYNIALVVGRKWQVVSSSGLAASVVGGSFGSRNSGITTSVPTCHNS